jgi:hypothetical protein
MISLLLLPEVPELRINSSVANQGDKLCPVLCPCFPLSMYFLFVPLLPSSCSPWWDGFPGTIDRVALVVLVHGSTEGAARTGVELHFN